MGLILDFIQVVGKELAKMNVFERTVGEKMRLITPSVSSVFSWLSCFTYLYIYLCMYYVYVYIDMHRHTQIHTCTHMYIHIYMAHLKKSKIVM